MTTNSTLPTARYSVDGTRRTNSLKSHNSAKSASSYQHECLVDKTVVISNMHTKAFEETLRGALLMMKETSRPVFVAVIPEVMMAPNPDLRRRLLEANVAAYVAELGIDGSLQYLVDAISALHDAGLLQRVLSEQTIRDAFLRTKEGSRPAFAAVLLEPDDDLRRRLLEAYADDLGSNGSIDYIYDAVTSLQNEDGQLHRVVTSFAGAELLGLTEESTGRDLGGGSIKSGLSEPVDSLLDYYDPPSTGQNTGGE